MRTILTIAIAVTAPVVTMTAHAQSDRSASAEAIVSTCLSRLQNLSPPQTTCACIAGALSDRTTDRQFEIMGRTVRHSGNQDGMRTAVQSLVQEGYTTEEIMTTGEMLNELIAPVSASCSER